MSFLNALWFSLVRFVASLFTKPSSAAPLPIPVTSSARPTSASVRVTHQRISLPYSAWVKEPSPLKSAASSPISSTARISPACRSRSATPKRAPSDPEFIFHPPASPFPHISLSGIFATPPLEPGQLSPALSESPMASPRPFRSSRSEPSPLLHTLHATSPRTPSSAVTVRLDRSSISPTTMSDGSLEIISLGDRRDFLGSPVKRVDMGRLPSPWSPIGKTASSNVWMSVEGVLVNATGPVGDTPARSWSQDDSRTTPRISAASLYSSHSALDAFGISVFVSLDAVEEQGNKDDPPKLNQVRDENRPALVEVTQTPRKRRDTLPSVAYSARTTKHLSTPLTKRDNADIGHVRSATSISSMAYELRMGLFADGRSISAFDNIISLLDQASPESKPPHEDAMQPVVAG
ncbi:hypothetical protein OG21DRAFT_1486523 [Imleria badia]|nr:hypothetical protein OG21DRAFT_1486523 [Imleria badia]